MGTWLHMLPHYCSIPPPCLPEPSLPCFHPVCRRAQKNECGPYQELAKLCGQDKGVAELAAFAQSKQAEFEAVRGWCG